MRYKEVGGLARLVLETTPSVYDQAVAKFIPTAVQLMDPPKSAVAYGNGSTESSTGTAGSPTDCDAHMCSSDQFAVGCSLSGLRGSAHCILWTEQTEDRVPEQCAQEKHVRLVYTQVQDCERYVYSTVL